MMIVFYLCIVVKKSFYIVSSRYNHHGTSINSFAGVMIRFELISGSARATITALGVVAVLRAKVVGLTFVNIHASMAIVRWAVAWTTIASRSSWSGNTMTRTITIVETRCLCRRNKKITNNQGHGKIKLATYDTLVLHQCRQSSGGSRRRSSWTECIGHWNIQTLPMSMQLGQSLPEAEWWDWGKRQATRQHH